MLRSPWVRFSSHVLKPASEFSGLASRGWSRSMFSPSYLDVSHFLDNQAKTIERIPSQEVMSTSRQRILAEPNLLGTDVKYFFHTTRKPAQIEEAMQVMRRFTAKVLSTQGEDSFSPQYVTMKRVKGGLLRDFFSLCHHLNQVEAARSIWNDPTILNSDCIFIDSQTLGPSIPMTAMTYADLMFENGHYHEVLATAKRLFVNGRCPIVTLVTLELAACLKLGTQESFIRAARVVDENRSFVNRTKAGVIYCLLAHNLGHVTLAYEEACMMTRGMLTTNLLVQLLTDLGRVVEAIQMLESSISYQTDSPHLGKIKPKFATEVIKNLSEAVEAARNPELERRVALVFDKLDNVAVLSPLTLEQMALSPIFPNKQKNTTFSKQPRSDHQYQGMSDEYE